jgi:hypothetical protein
MSLVDIALILVAVVLWAYWTFMPGAFRKVWSVSSTIFLTLAFRAVSVAEDKSVPPELLPYLQAIHLEAVTLERIRRQLPDYPESGLIAAHREFVQAYSRWCDGLDPVRAAAIIDALPVLVSRAVLASRQYPKV